MFWDYLDSVPAPEKGDKMRIENGSVSGLAIVLGLSALAFAGVSAVPRLHTDEPVGGEVVVMNTCTHCHTEGQSTACHTIAGCASNKVCSGKGGRLRNGQAWSVAECVDPE